MILCTADRREVLRMVRTCCLDAAAAPVVADWFEERGAACHAELRRHPDVSGWMACLEAGDWRCLSILKRCRGEVRRYASARLIDRAGGDAAPELALVPGPAYYPSKREWPWLDEALSSPLGGPASRAWLFRLYTLQHILALTRRGLAGYAVPSDVQRGLVELREGIRQIITEGGCHGT